MADVIEIPPRIACAECGAPVHCLTSFGLTAPIGVKVQPADFCGLACLATWAARNASGGRA